MRRSRDPDGELCRWNIELTRREFDLNSAVVDFDRDRDRVPGPVRLSHRLLARGSYFILDFVERDEHRRRREDEERTR
jgi:hypothetical protein